MDRTEINEQRNLAIALAGTAGLGVLAYGLAWLFGLDLNDQFHWRWRDGAIGIGATLPLIALLFWFMKTDLPALASFRRDQIDFFAQSGFRFTPFQIFLMSLFAGVFEELLFRGALQAGLARFMPVIFALIIASVLFGAMHWRTTLYAIIAAILGAWMGILFIATGNLLTPMICHGLYDVVALALTAKAIKERADNQANEG